MEAWNPPNKDHPPPKAGEPPLHRAARMGDEAAIRKLAAEGADLNQVFDMQLAEGAQPFPMTPLMVAAGMGDGGSVETLRLLIELGADPALVVDGETAASAVFVGFGWNYRPGGDAARLRYLLDAGSPLPPDPQMANQILCGVLEAGDSECARILLEKGLDPSGYFDPARALAQSREMHARWASYRVAFEQKITSPTRQPTESYLEQSRKREEEEILRYASAPSPYEIPLFYAVKSDSLECVRLLLDAGADPMVRDHGKETAMYAARSVAMIKALQAAGLPLEDANQFGWSPLVDAVGGGAHELPRITALIEAGADVNGTHDRGYTVFMSAVGSDRDPAVLRLLIASGANPHAVSELGYNAFHAAIDVNGEDNAEESARSTLGYLKELGVDIEHRNNSGHTPLARAIQDGTGIEVRVLCELGADPNAVCPMHDCSGGSCTRIDRPLLFHAANGIGVHRDVKTEALLNAGADPRVRDASGDTPLIHLAHALCADAADFWPAVQAFFTGLIPLQMNFPAAPEEKEAFIAAACAHVQEFVEGYGAGIPLSDDSDFTLMVRGERIRCLILLAAYEMWWEREQKRRAGR